MKKLASLLVFVLVIGMLAGCAGTPVANTPDTTPVVTTPDNNEATQGENNDAAAAVKTGLAILPSITKSKSATAEKDGVANYDVSIVAVTVDDNGVITSCIIDAVATKASFGADGAPVEAGTKDVATKNELGESYGMKKAGSTYEWNEQAAAVAEYAVGKTVEELKNGAVDESGKAKDADLATKATISIGGYVDAIEKAVANAQHLGAQAGDELKLAVVASVESANGKEEGGKAQLNLDAAVVTLNDGVITSCVIDALQAAVSFDDTGAVTTDLTAAPQTKNELGENYNMKKYGGATFEWNEQAANFSAYVTGKTAADVAGIAVAESGKPADADLSASVTIAIGGFQALIAKAVQ